MKTKVIGIIGCGRIANMAHFPTLSQIDSVRIKYACDLIIEKAQKAKNEYPKIENITTDYNDILRDPEIDAVYVLTPNYLHHKITMEALEAGKNVLCEKPVAVNYKLALEMANKAREKGLMLNIGVCNRFHKSVEMIAEMVRDGKLGNVYHVYCSFRDYRSIPGLGGAFTDSSRSGGGVLIDWGIHFFDLILYILGGAKLTSATCDKYCEMAKDMKKYKYEAMWAEDTANIENGINDVEDFITGYIRTDKASISFNGAWAQNIKKTEMFIDFLGNKGGVRLTYGGLFELMSGETLELDKPEYEIPNMYLMENISFMESIDNGKPNKGNIENVLESAKLLDILYKSASERKEVEVNG